MAESRAVQIREPGKHSLYTPETGYQTPKGGEQYSPDHPLVRAHPWAFGTAEEIAADQAAEPVTATPIDGAPENSRRGRAARKDLGKA